jgi:hypothetical protein
MDNSRLRVAYTYNTADKLINDYGNTGPCRAKLNNAKVK